VAVTDPETSKQDRARDLVRMVWLRNRSTTMERLAVVESALDALAAGELDAEGRAEAKSEAHKLRGILGTYGFAEGSVLAGEAEDLLEGTAGEGAAGELASRLGTFALTLPDG
jgi:HPt (histidine-containing phosphotransfer) domain-containing protein